MTYLIWFPYQGVVIGALNDKDVAVKMAAMINTGRAGTDAPEAEVAEIPVLSVH
jgi:hypothetical protein